MQVKERTLCPKRNCLRQGRSPITAIFGRLLEALIEKVGDDENHPQAAFLDRIGELIEEYEASHVPEILEAAADSRHQPKPARQALVSGEPLSHLSPSFRTALFLRALRKNSGEHTRLGVWRSAFPPGVYQPSPLNPQLVLPPQRYLTCARHCRIQSYRIRRKGVRRGKPTGASK